jgi:hypothetical protein
MERRSLNGRQLNLANGEVMEKKARMHRAGREVRAGDK